MVIVNTLIWYFDMKTVEYCVRLYNWRSADKRRSNPANYAECDDGSAPAVRVFQSWVFLAAVPQYPSRYIYVMSI